MRKILTTSILLLLLSISLTLADGIVYNLFKEGWGFNSGEEVGDTWGAIGLLKPVQPENPPIDFDYDNFEFTWALQDAVITGVEDYGVAMVIYLQGGSLGIYKDASFNFGPGSDPFDGIISATDGELVLGGGMYNAVIALTFSTETGSILGDIYFDSGSRLAEIEALNVSAWHIFNGMTWSPEVSVPDGYHSRFAGRIYSEESVATFETDWSRIKSLF